MPTRFILRLAGALCLLMAASVAASSRLDAQLCPPEGCTGAAPTVRILPAEGTWSDTLDTRTVSGTVDWCDDQPLQPGKHQVTLNGQPVATRTGLPDAAWCTDGFGSRSVFTVVLEHGGHSLAASTQDAEGLRGHASAGYAYHRQMPPSPAAPPAGLPCFVSRAEAVKAMYLQVLEREADPGGLSYYGGALDAGYTVRSIVLGMAQSSEHQGRFIFPDGRKTLTYLYRHLLARDPDPGAWGWVDVAATHGWNFVAHQLVYSQEYTDRFGDRGVPGDPVAAWDCGREGLALDPANAAPVLERDLCLTISAGDGAAYECGDLRLVHALPTVQTLNRARTPVLMYNQEHAYPRPIVGAYLTLPAGVWADTVRATLTSIDGAQLASGKWPAWAAGQERRIALQFKEGDWQGGLYGYLLQVQVTAGGSTVATYSRRGELAVVNRRASPFGTGWWLAGLEQLQILPDGRILWVGGDGSYRVYRPAGGSPSRWAASHVADRPDTLYTSAHPGAAYERRLPGGSLVLYSGSVRHLATVNRLGHETTFAYDNAGALQSISVPRQPGHVPSDVRYDFAPGGPAGRLWRITATGLSGATPVMVEVGHDGSGRVVSITDPDRWPVGFGYGTGSTPVLETRTDRRGTRTRFAYHYGKLASSTVEMQGTGDDIRLSFTPQEARGLVNAVPADSVHTLFDGPRPNACVPYQPCISPAVDETRFWVDRWGAPRRIRNALGHETHLTRGHPALPALVIRLRAPNGLETSAGYDSLGHVTTQTVHDPLGDGRSAVTTYDWNAKWSVPKRISRYEVSASGVRTQLVAPIVIEYDTATGHRIWQQQGDDAATRVAFRYYDAGAARGLLRAVDGPLSNPDSVAYDGFGNLGYENTGGVPTTYRRDGWGRVYESVAPGPDALDVVSRVYFDIMGRDTLTQTGDPLTQAIRVRKQYDQEGNLLNVGRVSLPDSAGIGWVVNGWEYDRANRARVEIAPDGTPESLADNPRDVTAFDAAGSAVSRRTRRGHDLTFRYDALGRLRSRTVPPAVYGPTTLMLPGDTSRFAAHTVPGEQAVFTYDTLGNVRTAENAWARITREYYPNGALRAETQHLATWNGTLDPNLHVYRLEHGYDLNGRRTWTRHPSNIAPRASGSTTPLDLTRYGYNAASGLLESVVDVMGNQFRYVYDAEGRLDSLMNVAGSVTEDRTYDGNGRLLRRVERGGPAYLRTYGTDELHDDAFQQYDRRGKLLAVNTDVVGGRGVQAWSRMRYSLLGALSRSEDNDPYREHDTNDTNVYTGDGTGNVYHQQNLPSGSDKLVTYLYQRGTGRLVSSREGSVPRDTAVFDASGNRELAAWGGTGAVFRSRSLYSADNRLSLVIRGSCVSDATGACKPASQLVDDNSGVREHYRYDALGRRIVTVEDRHRLCQNATLCHSVIERTVWDGDQLLYEIRMPADSSVTPAELERDTTTLVGAANAPYGRVTYTYGLQLDAPLSIVRMGYTFDRGHMQRSGAPASFFDELHAATAVFPHQTWRGTYDIGTFAEGLARDDGFDVRCKDAGGQSFCVTISWPSANTGFQHQQLSLTPSTSWMGSQIDGRRDASGLMYMRNRYYDPATARFTQEDPIGLAGGLNLYGFAAGDPVSYSDPYGLSADTQCNEGASEKCPIKLEPVVVTGTPGSKHHGRCEVAGFLTKYVERLGNPTTFIDGSYPAELDTKYYNRGDMFQVGDQWLRADEFGNYAAGYAGQQAYVEAGHLAMLAGGIAYAATRREEHWSDRDSRPMINEGASRARLEQMYDGRARGMRGIGPINTPYLEPLTSTANCK